MAEKSSRFINVDELMPQIFLEQAAAYYGVPLPELKQIGSEIRTRCFLACGHTEETGDRALAIDATSPVKRFRCHQYGCGKGGNLVSLCDLMKPGENMDGRPRGQRFKDIAADLEAMMGGAVAPKTVEGESAPSPAQLVKTPRVNVPLSESPNERARALVDLDQKFVVDHAEMRPEVAHYFRKRPFLTPDVCRRWRMGYLPRNTGGDTAGGTMRGKIVYPMLDQDGRVLTWFGRDPSFSEKHRQWIDGGKRDREPEKFRFVKGFHRGLCLFGEHVLAAEPESVGERLRGMGIVCVEGPNDVIALAELDIPAVAVCSNTMTTDQADKLAAYAHELAGGLVTLLFDCDPEGESGARQALPLLAERCAVRFGWSPSMHGGRFAGRQPESLTAEEWEQLWTFLL